MPAGTGELSTRCGIEPLCVALCLSAMGLQRIEDHNSGTPLMCIPFPFLRHREISLCLSAFL